MPCHYIIHCGWNVHWTPRNYGPIRNKVKYNIFVHPKKVGRGHGNGELVSVHLSAWLSIQGFWPLPKNHSIWGCIGPILSLIWRKIYEDGWNLWFPMIIQKNCCSINFKLGMYTCLMNLQNWFTFGMHWPISAICCQKITENGDFFYHYLENLSCLPNFIPLVSEEKWLKMVFFFSFTLNSCNRKNLPRPHCKDAVRSPQLIHWWLVCN